jgi:hypothetical protein
VTCNHCDHSFLADESGTAVEAESPVDGTRSKSSEAPTRRQRALARIADLRQRAARAKVLEAELASARKDHTRLNITRQVLKAELADRLAEVARLKRSGEDLITVRSERDQLESDWRAARDEVQDLLARLDDARRLNERLESRYQAASIERARENEESFRLWETERQELIAGWRQELRFAQEEAARQRDVLHAEAVDREQLLHAQFTSANRELEQEKEFLRARIDALESALDVARGECEQMLEQASSESAGLDRLRADLSTARHEAALAHEREEKLAEGLQLVQTLLERVRAEREQLALDLQKAGEDRLTLEASQREERARLEHDLGEARRWEELAIQREDQLIGQIKEIRTGLETAEHERDALRSELHELRQSASSQPLPPAAVAPAPAAEDASLLHHELARLQENLGELRRERDLAVEEVSALRLDRDRLHDNLARLEARLQEAECHDHTVLEQLRQESANTRLALAEADQREAELRTQLAALECRLNQDSADDIPPATEPQENPAPPVLEDAASAPTADDPVSAAPAGESEAPSPPPPAIDDLPRPEPLHDESPEARIHRLRSALRDDHEASSRHNVRPFFARIGRILGRDHSER